MGSEFAQLTLLSELNSGRLSTPRQEHLVAEML
jgi:hypothetical protein